MKIIVVVDMQNDFVDGSLGTKEAQMIVHRIVRKMKRESMLGTVVVFTKDTHGEDYLDTLEGKMLPVPHCIKGTDGHRLNREISTAAKDCTKYSNYNVVDGRIEKSTFASDKLQDVFRIFEGRLEEVEFVGVCTDICVVSNALVTRANFPNLKITVDAECCAGVTPQKHLEALSVMESCQINVINKES